MPGSMENSHRDRFRRTRHGVPGLLTPPSPYEGRRDSIASSQSSYCQSFASSEYSGPHTPLCGRSPFADEGFTDAMSYDMVSDLHSNSFHGLPLASQPKEISINEGTCDPWVMVPASFDQASLQPLPMRPLPSSGAFGPALHAPLDSQTAMHNILVTTADSAWGNLSTLAWPEAEQHPNHGFEQQGTFTPYCHDLGTSQSQQSMAVSLGTIIPSEAMFDIPDDYVHVHEAFGSSALVGADHSVCPSPEEVAFKREDSVEVKEEPEMCDEKSRVTRSMYETSTGGKSVKRERRNGLARKKTKMQHKVKREVRDRKGTLFTVELNNLDFDHVAKKWKPIESTSGSHLPCTFEFPDGRACGRKFKRPEHRKRHLDIHYKTKIFPCRLCDKMFGRNDNCLEHYWTHVRRPGKKEGRNNKWSMREVEEILANADPKIIEKLRHKWKTEVENAPRNVNVG